MIVIYALLVSISYIHCRQWIREHDEHESARRMAASQSHGYKSKNKTSVNTSATTVWYLCSKTGVQQLCATHLRSSSVTDIYLSWFQSWLAKLVIKQKAGTAQTTRICCHCLYAGAASKIHQGSGNNDGQNINKLRLQYV